MKFEEVVASDAAGTVLAHSHRLGAGRTVKKGRVLSDEDCRALQGAGITRITVARLEGDDLGEDEASRRVADAAAGPHLRVARATTGRANLFSEVRGLFLVSRSRVDEVNLLDEAITLATVPEFARVEAGELVATVKIIPFAVPARLVARACELARASTPLLAVAPIVRHRAGLMLTLLPGVRPEQLGHAVDSQRRRMARLGGEVTREVYVSHDRASVAQALAQLIDDSLDLVLVLGASAIVDRRDVVPSAIEAIGGVVDHLGMPVDPGNLLLLGHKGALPIVGVPGCARSLKPSGFDWVLERLAANVHVGKSDIMRLGVGGLLDRGTESP